MTNGSPWSPFRKVLRRASQKQEEGLASATAVTSPKSRASFEAWVLLPAAPRPRRSAGRPPRTVVRVVFYFLKGVAVGWSEPHPNSSRPRAVMHIVRTQAEGPPDVGVPPRKPARSSGRHGAAFPQMVSLVCFARLSFPVHNTTKTGPRLRAASSHGTGTRGGLGCKLTPRTAP